MKDSLFFKQASLMLRILPYAGKICAALDRQHPRDLFDIKILLENEGITDEMRKSFVIHLASSNRPMNEILDPVRKNILSLYEKEFLGMTSIPISMKELVKTREKIITLLNEELTNQERKFLISLKEGEPQWHLLGTKGIEWLPAIQWKLINIKKMNKKKHQESLEKLRMKLGL